MSRVGFFGLVLAPVLGLEGWEGVVRPKSLRANLRLFCSIEV